MTSHRHFQEYLKRFRDILAFAQSKRNDNRWDFVKVSIRGREYEEPSWLVAEVEVMHREVNLIRTNNGYPGIPLDDIWRVESSAKGHVDYSSKFALYCTELALYGKSP